MSSSVILGLDVGGIRTGVAISRSPVHIPSPLITISTDNLADSVSKLVRDESVSLVVAGLPRNLGGDSTSQTDFTRSKIAEIQKNIDIPIVFLDEAATSVKAKQELDSRKKPYTKEDVDMLAATYILDDYILQNPEIINV